MIDPSDLITLGTGIGIGYVFYNLRENYYRENYRAKSLLSLLAVTADDTIEISEEQRISIIKSNLVKIKAVDIVKNDLYNVVWAGSGLALTTDGYVLTANHVADYSHLVVEDSNNNRYYASKVFGDEENDIAIVKFQNDCQPSPLPLIFTNNVRGEEIFVYSFLHNKIRMGEVLRETKKRKRFDEPIEIKLSAATVKGDSGSPIINSYGEVVGIVTCGATIAEGDKRNLAFGPDSNKIFNVIREYVEHRSKELYGFNT